MRRVWARHIAKELAVYPTANPFLILSQITFVRFDEGPDSYREVSMLELILDGLFFGFLTYLLARVLFDLMCSPRFYEFTLLVTAPLGTYHYTNDLRVSLMVFVLSGFFVLLADTAFQSECKRTARKLPRA
jgi:hypothetical protein